MEPLAEGTEGWDAGESLDTLDIMSSLTRSPVLIPGVTTEQRDADDQAWCSAYLRLIAFVAYSARAWRIQS